MIEYYFHIFRLEVYCLSWCRAQVKSLLLACHHPRHYRTLDFLLHSLSLTSLAYIVDEMAVLKNCDVVPVSLKGFVVQDTVGRHQ